MRTYDNPVLPGFHPDPSVCRVGEDYYLVCSSFEYFPAVPVFHSRDLVHWRQIGNVLDRAGQFEVPRGLNVSDGIYAPTIRHHDGRFYVITTNVGAGGNFVVTAERPEGPWSDPVRIDLPGIDPDLAWDEDGTCWSAVAGVGLARVDPDAGKVLEGPHPVWSGTGMADPEGPHLYRIGDWWYLLVSEGGTAEGHSVSVARARSPRGPFEPAPHNPVVSNRSTGLPVRCTGHADLVQAADGTWWAVLLGTRPRGFFPRFHVLGRETFLVPVEWSEGWPHIGTVAERYPAPAAFSQFPAEPARDDFDGPALAPCYLSPRGRPDGSWSLRERPGRLTLHAAGDSLDRPGCTFVGRRQTDHDCRVAAAVETGPGGRAGLSVRMDEAHHYEIEASEGAAEVWARIGPLRRRVARLAVPGGPLTLAVECRTDDAPPPARGVRPGGPDTIAFSVESPEGAVTLAELDGRYLSTQVAGGFTGRVIGMYVTEGSAAFDWFEYRGRGSTAR
ncbi:glycoside hydrolase family 43 protein [Streptomyces sp. NPDC058867]|uniref:glycoside hydrolase family 43 protein n=1 Tax=unclassified Streptomyces TaxID=2593676 RepID=UPI0036AEA4B1